MVEIHFHSPGHAQPNVIKEKDNTELPMIFYSANTKESVQNKKMNENVDIPAEIFKANILAEVDTYVEKWIRMLTLNLKSGYFPNKI